MQLKQWVSTIHQLESLKSKKLTIPTLMMTQSNGNFHLLLIGIQNQTATLEGSLVIYYNTKHSFNHIILQWKFISKHKPAYNVYSSFIHNPYKLEVIKMYIYRQTDKQLCHNCYKEHYSILTRNELLGHGKIWMNPKYILVSKKK